MLERLSLDILYRLLFLHTFRSLEDCFRGISEISRLTYDVDLERVIDAGDVIANDAGVIAAVLHDGVLESQAPLVGNDGAEGPLRFLAVLQPRDVRLRIAHSWTSQSQGVSRRLHRGLVQLLGLVESRRRFRQSLIVLAGVLVAALFIIVVGLEMQRSCLWYALILTDTFAG